MDSLPGVLWGINMTLRILLFSAIAIFCMIFLTQVIIPAWHNRRLFPAFRKDRRKARVRLEEAKGKNLAQQDILEAAQTDVQTARMAAEIEACIEIAYDEAMDPSMKSRRENK